MAARAGLISRVGPRAATAYINVAGDFTDLHKGVAAESGALSKRGSVLGKTLAAGIGAGVLAGGGLFKIGEAFDAEVDKIRVGTGKTGKGLRRLQKDFKAVVQDVPADFDTAGTAITGLSQRLDLTGRPLRRLTKQVTELSRITGTDVGENVESLTRLFGDWSIETEKQSGTLDKLFRLSQRTGIGISDLSRFMVQFGSPLRQLGLDFDFSAAMFARFEKEGVNIQTLMPGLRFALKTFSKEGREPAEALRETFEAIENAGDAAEANQIAFETFGVRAGPDMAAAIREGRFDLEELIRSMRRGNDTVLKAADDTKDLSERWIEFRNRALVGLEPVATRVFNAVGREADQLFDILENPRLTTDEKIERVAERLSDGLSKAFPILANRAAQFAPQVAEAFVVGWLNAGIWGRLLVGGWLISKLGGFKAFRNLGMQGGAAFGAGLAAGGAGGGAAGAAAGAAGGTLAARLLSGLRKGLRIGGPLAIGAAIFGPELAKPFLQESKTMQQALRELEGRARSAAHGGFDEYIRSLRTQIRLSREAGTAIDRDQGDALERFSQDTFEISNRIERMSNDSSRSIKELRIRVAYNTKEIRERLGTDTKLGKDALAKNFKAAAENVRRSMREGTISTKRGTELIEYYMVRALQQMGFSKADAIALRNRAPGSTQTPFNGELRPNQRGSFIDVGKATGDSVPSLLERGEYVLNRNAVKRIGRAALDRINFKMAPRFQAGGIVELLHPFNDPEGHGGDNSHLHIGTSTPAQVIRIGRWLQSRGWLVGEHPAFGGVNFSHAPGGHHYNATGIDVNWPDASQEAAKIRAILPLLGSGRFHIPGIRRVLATGPDGPLKTLVQAALDTTRAGAKGALQRALSPIEGSETAPFRFQSGGAIGRFGATSYGPPWGGINGMGVTATGIDLRGNPRRHIIAVDPSVLKLGQKYWAWPNPFNYRGAFLAGDTGGAIKGNRIDFYDWRGRAAQYGWGHKDVTIYSRNPWTNATKARPGGSGSGTLRRQATFAPEGSFGTPGGRSPFTRPGSWGGRRPNLWRGGTQPVDRLRDKTTLGQLLQGRGDRIEMAAALAALTPGLADDIAAAEDRVAFGRELLTGAMASGDPVKIAEVANGLKSAIDSLDALKETIDEGNRLQEQRDQVNRELLESQQRTEAMVKAQGPALMDAFATWLNNQTGNRAAAGRGFPSFTGVGGLARA